MLLAVGRSGFPASVNLSFCARASKAWSAWPLSTGTGLLLKLQRHLRKFGFLFMPQCLVVVLFTHDNGGCHSRQRGWVGNSNGITGSNIHAPTIMIAEKAEKILTTGNKTVDAVLNFWFNDIDPKLWWVKDELTFCCAQEVFNAVAAGTSR